MFALMPIIGAVLPFVLWPLELFFPYPAIVEELAKAAVIFWSQKEDANRLSMAKIAAFGFFFALSESVLYLFNIIAVGSFETFILRLLLTIPLHSGTSAVISLFIFKGKRWALVGICTAITVHFIFNAIVRNYLTLSSLTRL